MRLSFSGHKVVIKWSLSSYKIVLLSNCPTVQLVLKILLFQRILKTSSLVTNKIVSYKYVT